MGGSSGRHSLLFPCAAWDVHRGTDARSGRRPVRNERERSHLHPRSSGPGRHTASHRSATGSSSPARTHGPGAMRPRPIVERHHLLCERCIGQPACSRACDSGAHQWRTRRSPDRARRNGAIYPRRLDQFNRSKEPRKEAEQMDTLKAWMQSASDWIAANPTDVVYAALIVAGLTLITGNRK